MDEAGNALLFDFGLSKALGGTTGLTTSKDVKITLVYAAPELLQEGGEHSTWSDVWAWGCLLVAVRCLSELMNTTN